MKDVQCVTVTISNDFVGLFKRSLGYLIANGFLVGFSEFSKPQGCAFDIEYRDAYGLFYLGTMFTEMRIIELSKASIAVIEEDVSIFSQDLESVD